MISAYASDRSVYDVRVIHTSGSGVANNNLSIWIQMGESYLDNIPIEYRVHKSSGASYTFYPTNQPFHSGITESGTTYELTARYGWYNGAYEIEGDLRVQNDNPAFRLRTNSPTDPGTFGAIRGNNDTWLFGYGGASGSEDISIGTQDQTGSRTLTMAAGGQARMKILADGNIGIGTTNPDEKLTVKGNIHAEEVKVDLSVPGPDYVFEEDYNLQSLEALEKFIQSYKHLPEVPSAKEMEENGIEVGVMNMLLLKKIEELTLHTIAQQKRIEEQENINLELLNRIQKLENSH